MLYMALPVSFRWSGEFVAAIDRARGDVPRSVWVRRAVEQALSEAKEPFQSEQTGPGSVPSSEGVRSAAPAEQPRGPLVDEIVERYPETVGRESIVPLRARHGRVGPKRSVEPIPKGGKS